MKEINGRLKYFREHTRWRIIIQGNEANSGMICRYEILRPHRHQPFFKNFFIFKRKWMKPHFIVFIKSALTTMGWATCPILLSRGHIKLKTRKQFMIYYRAQLLLRVTSLIYNLTENVCGATSNERVSKFWASTFLREMIV